MKNNITVEIKKGIMVYFGMYTEESHNWTSETPEQKIDIMATTSIFHCEL